MQRWLAYAFGLASLAFLGIFYFYPLSVILWRSLSSLNLSILQNQYYLERLGFTLFQALLSTFFTVVLAVPAALLFARYHFWGKGLLKVAFTIPFVLPSVVAGIGFLALVGPRGLSGINLYGTLTIILLAHVFYNYAVVVRIVSGYMESLGTGFQEVAAMLGAGGIRTVLQVSLPLARPAIVAAAILVFTFCFTSFGVIMILAPQPRFATLEVEIYRLLSRLLELDNAAILTLLQLGVVSIMTLVYTRLQENLQRVYSFKPLASPRGWAKGVLLAYLALTVLLILSPLMALLGQTFASGFPALAQLNTQQPSIGFTGLGPALKNSLMFALGSMVLSLALGFACAYAIVRGNWKHLDNLSLWPLATSPITLGFGYLLAFPALAGSPWGIMLAHSLLAFPFVTRSLLPALRSLPYSLIEAAKTLGASSLGILCCIELPLLKKAFLSAASFAFAISLGEFGATLVLQNPDYATLPLAIFDRLSRPGLASYGAALALSSILMLLAAMVMILLEHLES